MVLAAEQLTGNETVNGTVRRMGRRLSRVVLRRACSGVPLREKGGVGVSVKENSVRDLSNSRTGGHTDLGFEQHDALPGIVDNVRVDGSESEAIHMVVHA